MPVALEEPMYRILRAQQANIARIETGLVLPGTSGDGEEIELWGPKPNLIKMYDHPMRHLPSMALNKWERIVGLAPNLLGPDAARTTRRNDQEFSYDVWFLVRLLDSEAAQDRAQVPNEDNIIPDSILAQKSHRLISDFHYVFFDNHHLETDDCPNGLVDDQEYTMSWDRSLEWPFALFIAEVRGTRSGH